MRWTAGRSMSKRSTRAAISPSAAATTASAPTEDAKASLAETVVLAEQSTGQQALVELKGRPAAGRRIGEDVVDGDQSAGRDEWHPRAFVGANNSLAMTPVDEQQGQGRLPEARHRRRFTDHTDDGVTQASRLQRAPEERKRVHATGRRVDDLVVVMLPTGLVLFAPTMVVDA